MADPSTARHNMVENQLRPNRIVDARLLAVMGRVPRELFVPERMRGVAYADEDIPVGRGRFLVEPLAVAKLVQGARVEAADVALVVSDLTGYTAAVVAGLAAAVHLLLPDEDDRPAVEAALRATGAENVTLHTGDPGAGLPEQAPFDAAVLVGRVKTVPQPVLDQLADGGRLATVVEQGHSGRVVVMRKVKDAFGTISPFDASIPPLPGLRVDPGFVF